MRKLLLLFVVLATTIGSAMAQKSVTGRVTGDDGAPMIGVTVVVKGTVTGTVTSTTANGVAQKSIEIKSIIQIDNGHINGRDRRILSPQPTKRQPNNG